MSHRYCHICRSLYPTGDFSDCDILYWYRKFPLYVDFSYAHSRYGKFPLNVNFLYVHVQVHIHACICVVSWTQDDLAQFIRIMHLSFNVNKRQALKFHPGMSWGFWLEGLSCSAWCLVHSIDLMQYKCAFAVKYLLTHGFLSAPMTLLYAMKGCM